MKKIINVETLILDSVLGKIDAGNITWPNRFDFAAKIEFLRRITEFYKGDLEKLTYIETIKEKMVNEERRQLTI